MMQLLNTGEAAAILGVAPQTLAILRVQGGGPKYAKLGRRVVYDVRDLEEYVAARKCSSTSEY